jgi:transcriptional regulator with XRE-family HTH domain
MGKPVSEQLREAINSAGVSRYRISKASGVSEAALSKFVRGLRGLDLSSVDRLASHLGLELVKAKQRGARKVR